MIKVVFFHRKPMMIHKSIEFIFADIRKRLGSKIEAEMKVFSFFSKGLLNRLLIMIEAAINQGDVNHVTGDIHFATIFLKKTKTILTIHDCGMLLGTEGWKHYIFKFFWFILPLKKCQFVTVVSQTTKDDLIKFTNYPSAKIHIIPVAVSDKFRYHPKVFNSQMPNILQFCTTPNKNTLRVIEAVSNISCKLLLIGPLDGVVKNRLNQLGICYENFANLSLEQLVEQYKKSDLVSFVSTHEGFGMPIIEAQATGRPVLTSNISSMPVTAGGAACLVNPFEINDIRDGILKIIRDEQYRTGLIEQGRLNCLRFDANTIANQYLHLYETVSIANNR